jgi:hypothetical protein
MRRILNRLFRVNAATITIGIVLLGIVAYQRVPFPDLMESKTLDLRFVSRGSVAPGPEGVLPLHPRDGPSQTMLSRCTEFKANPPDKDWDGGYTMATK